MSADQTTLNHTARVLATVTPQLPADAALRKYFYGHTYLAPQLRRSISRSVFIYYRWLRWLSSQDSFQAQVGQALQLDARFKKDPNSIKAEALLARAIPEWVKTELEPDPAMLRQLQREPALWLRARPGKAHHLAKTLGHCTLTPHAPDAVQYTGEKDLFRTAQFHEGEFEIQDLASQLVGLAAAPLAGQTWWDTCAGEGGKTLHLADQMQNKGVVWVSDRSEKRLQVFKKRSTRAKLYNHRSVLWDGSSRLPTKAKFDGILVDAPCSGVGTWQRNPHARWTTTIDDVRELAATQLSLLNHVANSLKPGGRLIYAVCTLTRSETTDIVTAFSAAHPELTPAPITLPGREPAGSIFIWPQEVNANGMFIAAWTRAS